MVEDRVKTDVFEISEDELNHRMEAKKEHDEPMTQAVRILEAAVDKVLEKLGVNIGLGDIPAQMDALGIIMSEHTEENAPQLNGFFVYVSRFVPSMQDWDIIPYAWVGAARVNSNGECFCDIQWFQDNRLDETGGIKIIK